jgi:hypothetical protein
MNERLRKYRVSLIGAALVLVLLLVNAMLPSDPPNRFHPFPALSGFLQVFVLVFLFLRWSVKRKKVLLFNVGLFLGLAIAAEFTCFLLLDLPAPVHKEFKLPQTKPDHIATHLGQVPNANKTKQGIKVVRGDTVFNVDYTIDQYSRRQTPGFDSSRSRYALFFGCSVCFGFGLEDDQTLPFHFQQATGHNAYNYGYPGYGSHHMLARFDHKNLSEQVQEKDGIGIYVFIGAHVRRNIGDMKVYNSWGHTMPYYHYDSDGKVVRDGNFYTGRSFTNWLYVRLDRSSFMRYFDIGMPFWLRRKHLELTADMILESKARYQEQFGNDKFYVLIHPMSYIGFTPENQATLRELLDERGIQYFDCTDQIELDIDHRLKGDPHPNERTYREVSALLAKDLGLLEE